MDTFLTILGILVGIMVIFVVSSFFFYRNYERRCERRLHAVNVVMAQKYDVLIMLSRLLKANNIKLPADLEDEVNGKTQNRMKILTTTERQTIKTYLMKTSQTLIYYAEQNKGLARNNEYQVLKKSLVEIDDSYRKTVAFYNAEVLGYNFWIALFPGKYVARLFSFKSKEMIL